MYKNKSACSLVELEFYGGGGATNETHSAAAANGLEGLPETARSESIEEIARHLDDNLTY